MVDLTERLRKRAKEDRQCAENNKAVVEALAEQMRLFDAREGHNVYAVRMAVDHKSGMERDTRYADDLEAAATELEALRRRVEELEGALKPFADRCAEAVRPDDMDNDGVTVKTVHLRKAAAAIRALAGGAGE